MKYAGQLAYHIEMCCGAWPQFHDNRGLHGDKNQYWDWNWTINFQKGIKINNIQIIDNDGNTVYNGPWTYSRKNTSVITNGFGNPIYFPSPEEIDPHEWADFCRKGYSAFIDSDEVVDALKLKEGVK